MIKAIYPGSFDPITYGHIDIIKRAASLVDELVVVIMINEQKLPTFSVEERIEMIKECVKELTNVKVEAHSGLTVDFAESIDAKIIIRGIRAVMDYEYELQQSTINMMLGNNIETIFLMSKPEYSFLSSSSAKTVALYDGDLSRFVPENVARKMRELINKN